MTDGRLRVSLRSVSLCVCVCVCVCVCACVCVCVYIRFAFVLRIYNMCLVAHLRLCTVPGGELCEGNIMKETGRSEGHM